MGIPEPLAWFFVWLGRTSLQASVLIVLVMAALALTRDRLAPRWRHGLWMLLVIRLLLPWAPPSRMSVFNYFDPLKRIEINRKASPVPPPVAAEPALSMAPSVQYLLQTGDRENFESPAADPIYVPTATSQAPAAAPDMVAESSPRLPEWIGASWLAALWLGGFLALMSLAVSQSLALGAALRKQRPVTDQRTLDLLEACKDTLGVRAWLAVVEAPGIASPALLGFVRPRLLLPAGAIREMGPDRLRHIFLHELAHLKRRDILMNWVMTALQAVHWFNPLVWLAFRRMREDRELACDALVLASLGPEESSEYGRTIIHLLERFARPRRLAGLAGILEDKQQIKRRLTMIARFKRPSLIGSVVAASLMLLLGGAALTSARTERVEVEKEARGENKKDTREMKYQVIETRTDGEGALAGKGGKQAAAVSITDFKLVPGEKDGQYMPVVSIKNNGTTPTPAIDVKFFRNDEERKNQGMNGAGPIKPGETWNETPGPMTLNEGENRFTVVLDPNGKLQEGVKAPAQAELKVTVKDGKIVGKGLSIKVQGARNRGTGSSYSFSSTANDKAAKTRLESAEAAYELAQKRAEAGLIDKEEVIKAEMTYRQAASEAVGNKVAAAQAKTIGLQKLVDLYEKKFQMGLITEAELLKVRAELETAKAAEAVLEHAEAAGDKQKAKAAGEGRESGETQVQTITKDGKTITIITKSKDPTQKPDIFLPKDNPYILRREMKPKGDAAADQKARAELERTLASQKALIAQARALAEMARKQLAENPNSPGQQAIIDQAQKMQEMAQKQLAETQAKLEAAQVRLKEGQARIEKMQMEMQQRFDGLKRQIKPAPPTATYRQKSGVIKGGVQLQIKEIRIEPADGGRYRVVVSVGNEGKETIPQFKVYMIRNADAWKKAGGKIDKAMGSHGVGPVKPGETWNEASLPFALNEGENPIAIVIDPENAMHEAVPMERTADLVVTFKDGKITGQRVSIRETSKGGKGGTGYGFSIIGLSTGHSPWQGGQGGFGGMMGGGSFSGGFGGGTSYQGMPPAPRPPAFVPPAPPAPQHKSGGGGGSGMSFDGVRPAKVAPVPAAPAKPVIPAKPAKPEKSDTESEPIAQVK